MAAQAEINADIKRPITWVRRKIVTKNDLDRLEELIDLSKVGMEDEPRFEISNCECQGACQHNCNDSCERGCQGSCFAFCQNDCTRGCQGGCMGGCANGCRAAGQGR